MVWWYILTSSLFFTSGTMRGLLRKKGKEDNSWNLRLFVLSANENSLSYFIKDQVCDLYSFVHLTSAS